MRRITGELAAITEAAMGEATAVIRNARRALRSAKGHRKGQLHRAINRSGQPRRARRTCCGPDA